MLNQITDMLKQKDENKNRLDNLLNESNAKERDLEILKKRVMIETNELNNCNGRIDFKMRRGRKTDLNEEVGISVYVNVHNRVK